MLFSVEVKLADGCVHCYDDVDHFSIAHYDDVDPALVVHFHNIDGSHFYFLYEIDSVWSDGFCCYNRHLERFKPYDLEADLFP